MRLCERFYIFITERFGQIDAADQRTQIGTLRLDPEARTMCRPFSERSRRLSLSSTQTYRFTNFSTILSLSPMA